MAKCPPSTPPAPAPPAAPTLEDILRKARGADGHTDLKRLTMPEVAMVAEALLAQGAVAANERKPFMPRTTAPAPAPRSLTGRRRRVAARFRPHLGEMARLYVAEGKRVTAACERIRRELGQGVTPATLAAWAAGSVEFDAHVREAEVNAAEAAKTQPSLRSPRDLTWLQAVQVRLRDKHDAGELSDKERDTTLKAILSVQQEIRAEEAHIESLHERASRRSFARFLRALIAWLRDRYPQQMPGLAEPLREAAKHLDQVVTGRELQGVGS